MRSPGGSPSRTRTSAARTRPLPPPPGAAPGPRAPGAGRPGRPTAAAAGRAAAAPRAQPSPRGAGGARGSRPPGSSDAAGSRRRAPRGRAPGGGQRPGSALGRSSGTLRLEPEEVQLRRCLLSGLRARDLKGEGGRAGGGAGARLRPHPPRSAAGTRGSEVSSAGCAPRPVPAAPSGPQSPARRRPATSRGCR